MQEPNPESTALAVQNPEVTQQLRIVTSAIEVSLNIRELTTDFTKRSEKAVADAFSFTTPPETDEDQEETLKVQRAAAALRIEVTKQAEAFKSPLNAARARIIDLHKTGIAALEKAEKHLEGLIQHRQQKLRQAQKEADAAAESERQRIVDESAAAQRALDEAERTREAARLKEIEAEGLKGKKKAEAEAEAARLKQEAETQAAAAEDAALLAELAPAVVAAPVSDAPMAREVYDFEIIGRTPGEQQRSLIALANQHPELFSAHLKSETPRGYSLTLKIADLTDRLNGRLPAYPQPIHGITITTKLTKLR